MENVTNGVNLLAQGLHWESGDRLILNDLEFPANVYPFLNLKKKGVIIDFVKSRDGKVDAEEIGDAIKPETKLVSISHVQFLTGYRADMTAIGKLCKENNIIFSVDAIQSAGAVQIDVKKMDIDILTGGSQKWLMGLQGCGYIYLTEEIECQIEPAYVGWFSVENAWNLLDYDLTLRKGASRFQCGTSSHIGIAALDASLGLMEKIGYSKIEDQIISNTKYFIEYLCESGFDTILKNIPGNNLAGIISLHHEDAENIFNKLKENNIDAAIRDGVLRFAPHFYNTKEDIDKVIDVMKNLYE